MNTQNILRTLFCFLLISSLYSISAQENGQEEFNESEFNFDPETNNEPKQFDAFQFDQRLQTVRGIMIAEDDRVGAAKSYKKIDQGLQGFLKTTFMKKIKEFKLEVESLASTFKAHQYSFKPDQIVKVKKAYVIFADKYNLQLQEIKRDFLNPKKLKMIRTYPDMYAGSLELKLRELVDEYSQNLEKPIAEITGTDEYSAIPIMAILSIIKFGVDFSNYLARMRYDNRKVKEEHLNQFFIEPFKMRPWEEVETIGSGYGGDMYNNNYNNNEMNSDPMDYPLENEVNNTTEKEKNKENIYEMNPFAKKSSGTQKRNNF